MKVSEDSIKGTIQTHKSRVKIALWSKQKPKQECYA